MRYALPPTRSCRTGRPESCVSGLPLTGDHPMHPFVIDAQGTCLRRPGLGDECLPGAKPDAGLAGPPALHRAGDPRRHLALRRQQDRPGILAGRALCDRACATARASRSIPPAGSSPPSTAATSFAQNWPELYTPEQGAELPAEEVVELERRAAITAGRNAISTAISRSSCWRRNMAVMVARRSASARRSRRRSRLLPGALGAERSGDLQRPAVSGGLSRRRLHRLPRLMEPRTRCRRAATMWSSSRGGRQGVGPFRRFRRRLRRRCQGARPCCLPPDRARRGAPDGAIYISDDEHGRIWRVTYHGAPERTSWPRRRHRRSAAADNPPPPEGVHPDAGAPTRMALPMPRA